MPETFDVAAVSDLTEYVTSRLDGAERPFFTLILGAGFTYPLVPTARRMLTDIPWWLHWRQSVEKPAGSGYARQFRDRPFQDEQLENYERDLWKRLFEGPSEKTIGELKAGLPDVSLPGAVTGAYKLLMTRALKDLKTRRQYLRDAIGRIGRRINPPHLHLAGILGSQDSEAWQWKSPFCRTVLTTNFDPLLQRSLQLVHKLYFMSDRPEMIDAPEDDDTEAIHLMYTHGSVHRYRLLNTEKEIADARERNARELKRYLERHSVIIIGYNGWDDATMDALATAADFDGQVFWCDILDPASAATGLSPQAVEFLTARRGTASYVKASAAELLEELHRAVVGSPAPEFVIRPLSPLLRQLRSVELTEREAAASVSGRQEINSFAELVRLAIKRLEEADRLFTAPSDGGQARVPPAAGEAPPAADVAVPADASPGELASRAVLAAWSGDSKTAMALLSRIIDDPRATAEERADALVKRGKALEDAGSHAEAVADLEVALTLVPADSALAAKALDALTSSLPETGRHDDALAAYEKLLAHPAIEPAERASALFRRGILFGELQRKEEELADYNAAAESPGISDLMRAGVLINRGSMFRERGEIEKSVADYNQVLATPGLPGWMRARALRNRGNALMDLGREDEALDDYLPVIEIEDATVDDRSSTGLRAAGILMSRGNWRGTDAIFRKLGRVPAIAQSPEAMANVQLGVLTAAAQLGDQAELRKAAAELLANPSSSAVARSLALRLRGQSLAASGEHAAALESLNESVEIPGLDESEIADALMVRATFFHEQGRAKQEEADYTRVIGLAGASDSNKADAYMNRAWARYRAGDYEGLIADSRSALAIDPERGFARANLSIGLLLTSGEAAAVVEMKSAATKLSAVSEVEAVIKDLDDLEKSGKADVSSKSLRAILEARRTEIATADPGGGG
ncbi:MAG: hypothetical protein GIKADHBN_02746 [Phycisphaerales bacterium]|nr:hypothetical protein [Phycisphaerales bacterium]